MAQSPINIPISKRSAAHNDGHIMVFKIHRRDGNENVALKVNLRSFSLKRNYFYPSNFK